MASSVQPKMLVAWKEEHGVGQRALAAESRGSFRRFD